MSLSPHHKKCKRYDTPGEAHELTFSCYLNQSFLTDDRTRYYLVDAINKAKIKHQFDLWAYVFMLEHVHLLIWPTQNVYSTSEILKSIKQSVSRRAIGYIRKHNPGKLHLMATNQKYGKYRFWQDGGGYDRNMRTRVALINSVEYIHNNPVRRGLVANPGDWKWSSFLQWEGYQEGLLQINLDSFPQT